MTAFMGIDPGKRGGLAMITNEGANAWRWPGDIAAAAELLRELQARQPVRLAAVEKVASRPGQGVASMFAFGQNFGAWLGMLAALGIPHVLVTPRKWQAAMLDAGTGDTKARSLNMARRLFPEVDLRHKADDGKADALHLARYAMREAQA